jgi:hypothetical protein
MRKHLLPNSINSQIEKLINNPLNFLYYSLIYFYIMVAFTKLLLPIVAKEPDFNSIMNYAERGIILITTLAALTFTYATAALESSEKTTAISSGKYFLKSLLNFVGGIIFLIACGDVRNNPSNLLLSAIAALITLYGGLVMLLLSAYFLVLGVNDLSKSLEKQNVS